MGTLIFVCPTTGHQVSTGVDVDRSSFKSLPWTRTAIFCPRCGKHHLLSRIWAWLDSNVPFLHSPADKPASVEPSAFLLHLNVKPAPRATPIGRFYEWTA